MNAATDDCVVDLATPPSTDSSTPAELTEPREPEGDDELLAAAAENRELLRRIGSGEPMFAHDGVAYVASHLKQRRVQFTKAKRPANSPALLAELQGVAVVTSMTLRRQVPKVRGKKAHKQLKRDRLAARSAAATRDSKFVPFEGSL